MLIRVAAIGQRMPGWVNDAWQEYARRFPKSIRLELIELPLQHRGRNADVNRLVRREGAALMNAVPNNGIPVALDLQGQSWSTQQLAEKLESWMASGSDVCCMIGGPDGLSAECLARAGIRWSLGPLTLPHPLVRVVIVEQLYRAWSIISHHPYHRE